MINRARAMLSASVFVMTLGFGAAVNVVAQQDDDAPAEGTKKTYVLTNNGPTCNGTCPGGEWICC